MLRKVPQPGVEWKREEASARDDKSMNQVDDCLRIGLMGIGLEAYWKQFEGLEQRLQGYLDVVAAKIASNGRSVVKLGLIDTPKKACFAGHECRRQDIDVLVIYVTTYALSSTVLPVVLRAKVPVLLLNLQPEAKDFNLTL